LAVQGTSVSICAGIIGIVRAGAKSLDTIAAVSVTIAAASFITTGIADNSIVLHSIVSAKAHIIEPRNLVNIVIEDNVVTPRFV
jgi:hypothetical protein